MPHPNSIKKKIIFILGPTAVGKSETAVYLAKKIKAEIISCDSMQVYKGMSIITSKPGRALLKKIRHHLIGVVPLERDYDAASFRKDALKEIKGIFKRGKIPLIVGGTGLYSSVLVYGIFDCKAEDISLRNKFYGMAKSKGNLYLYRKLKKVDPRAAGRIHANDTRRIVRALEVFEVTGKPISVLQKERRGLKDKYDVRLFCLNMPRESLYDRINTRVKIMVRKGLINEVKGIMNKPLSRAASFAIGLKEISGYIKGECSKQEAIGMIKINTRHYAKRQLTWFRKDKSTIWINIHDKDKPEEIADKIYKHI